MNTILKQIRSCRACEAHLEINPILAASKKSKIIIIGQAPGKVVHNSGIPWKDKSGENLRSWLGIGEEIFYNPEIIALIPMGFCYPGTGRNGDLPPRPECAPLWHQKLLSRMTTVKLTLLIGQYAQNYYLGDNAKSSLTETVQHFKSYLPGNYFPLPHPSPRNNIWQAKNPWFAAKVLPELKRKVKIITTT
jgi:uracil-DNA glycosylase